MSEFTATNHYVTSNGGKNGRVAPVNGNGQYNGGKQPYNSQAPAHLPIEDQDEFEDRGHWGSKAEFILSCVGSLGVVISEVIFES